jgi:hypothetical protein
MPLAGIRDAEDGGFYNAGDFAFIWSSSPEGDDNARFAVLLDGDADVFNGWNYRELGLSLRFLADKK